jgi:hypothetical protein
MPIFRTELGLGYFADVPGCGGAAVLRHLEARFGPLAFHDPAHTEGSPHKRWSRTSPQHVGRKTLARLFPPGFFALSLAVVRHPVDRLRAVYAFQRDVEGMIPRSTEFHEWLEDIAERTEGEPFVFDNAVRPMADLVPEDAEVFRYEDGPDPVVARLDGMSRAPAPVLELRSRGAEGPEPSAIDLDRIAELYAVDFKRFGYGGWRAGEARPVRRRFLGARQGG